MTIAEFDHLGPDEKRNLLFQCCASRAWVEKMMTIPPAEDLVDLLEEAEEKWYECSEDDWKAAFANHPKIGDLESLAKKFATDKWAGGEQESVRQTSEDLLKALAEKNELYEKKFGYIFIVFATGKTAGEMLDLLNERLKNDPAEEIKVAALEQNKITQLRLSKFFA